MVAGEFYDDPKMYEELSRTLDIQNAVVYRNEYIPQDEVKYYFCASSIVAQTYRTATQSGVTQIAYHFGRPMLVTDVGGLAEIVPNGKAGFVVEVNEKAIASSLARFFQENLEKPFGDFVATEKERFSWSHFSKKFISFLTEL